MPQDKFLERPGPSGAEVASPHLPAGSAAAYSVGASIARTSVHAGPGAVGAAPRKPSPASALVPAAVASAAVPGTPQSLNVNLTPVQAIITWAAPASNGGAALDLNVVNTYVYAANSWQYLNSVESCGACTTAHVVGLQPDTYYAFYVYAHNSSGFSYPAAVGGLLNDAAADCYPSIPQAVAGNGTMTVSWGAPYAAAAYSQGQLYYSVLLVPWGAERSWAHTTPPI